MANIVELKNIRKVYLKTAAVDDVSFSVPEKSIFGMLGPNGSGKTTTIRMITSIIMPDSGQVLFGNEMLQRNHTGKMGYMPEERGLYKKMKVWEQLVYLGYETEISKGILLHRFIDNYTDTHKEVSELKKLLRPQFGLLSGVVIDMLYDHQLAKHWSEFNTDTLESFTTHAYNVFEKFASIMPERPKAMLHYMRKENWLLNYARAEGMTKSFNGMAQRIRKGELLLQAPAFMQQHDAEVKESFFRFFPELIIKCEEEKERLYNELSPGSL